MRLPYKMACNMKLRQFISCSVFYIMLLCSSTLLFSCEEEEIWNPKDSSSWGYFDGEINGEKVHLQNTVYKDYINKGSRYTHSNKFLKFPTPNKEGGK